MKTMAVERCVWTLNVRKLLIDEVLWLWIGFLFVSYMFVFSFLSGEYRLVSMINERELAGEKGDDLAGGLMDAGIRL